MANITFTYGSGINDSIFGKVQAPIQSFIEKRGEAWEQKSLIGSIFASTKSKHFGEQYGSMTAMDGFQPVGENQVEMFCIVFQVLHDLTVPI